LTLVSAATHELAAHYQENVKGCIVVASLFQPDATLVSQEMWISPSLLY
jgi:hypothetical protein